MNEFKDYLEELITSARDEEDQNPDDYIGPDGLMYCGECRTKKQRTRVFFEGKSRWIIFMDRSSFFHIISILSSPSDISVKSFFRRVKKESDV